ESKHRSFSTFQGMRGTRPRTNYDAGLTRQMVGRGGRGVYGLAYSGVWARSWRQQPWRLKTSPPERKDVRNYCSRLPAPVQGLTLMRTPIVKRQTTPMSGFLAFFPRSRA